MKSGAYNKAQHKAAAPLGRANAHLCAQRHVPYKL